MIPLNRRFLTYHQMTDPGNTNFDDYFTGNFVTYFPKRMKPSTLQGCMRRIFTEVYSHQNNCRRVFSRNIFNSTFGVAHGYEQKRMNDTVMGPVSDYYMEYLKEIEHGLYDHNEVLMEDKLAALKGLPCPPPLIERTDYPDYERLSLLLTLPGLVRGFAARLRTRLAGPAEIPPLRRSAP
jgi:hypothetical protein